jgi:hypothetical protein
MTLSYWVTTYARNEGLLGLKGFKKNSAVEAEGNTFVQSFENERHSNMASLSKTARLWKFEISCISLVMSLLKQKGTSHRTEIGISHLLQHFAEVTHLFKCFNGITHLFKCCVEVKHLFKCFIEIKHLFKFCIEVKHFFKYFIEVKHLFECFIPIYGLNT